MGLPELVFGTGLFGQFGGAAGDIAAGDGPVAKDIAQAVAQRVARLDDAVIGGAAVGAAALLTFGVKDES